MTVPFFSLRFISTLKQARLTTLALLEVSLIGFIAFSPAYGWDIHDSFTPEEVQALKVDVVSGHTDKVYQILKEPIFSGELIPQFLMGLTHEQAQNNKNALDWYRIAAQGNSPHAQYRLGLSYEHGYLGLSANYSAAFGYYQKAAKKGYAKAQFKLATIYDQGLLGVEISKKDAFVWYEKSAQAGIPLAQFALGNMYNTGTGTHKEVSQAYHWYEKSAEQGLAVAQYKLGQLYQELSLRNNPEEDREKAFQWFEKSAKQGYALAQLALGLLYEEGLTFTSVKNTELELSEEEASLLQEAVPQYKEAAYWYKKAAMQGNAEGQMALGTFYMMGWGVDQDYEQAKQWLEKSKQQGNGTASTWLELLNKNHPLDQVAQK